MWWNDAISLVFVISSIGACVGACTALLCSNMRMSRCRKIQLCCGCFSCDRENLSETEYNYEIENQHKIEDQMQPKTKPRSNSLEEITV
jgi:hypothetical protein